MSTVQTGIVPPGERAPKNYLSDFSIKSWLLTTDHKRIGLMYMAGITLFFFVGGAAATIMRFELMTPRGDVLDSPD